MNLFDLYAKLSLDDSDFTSKVKKAGSDGDSLASKLKSGLSSVGDVVSKGFKVAGTAAVAFGGSLLALEANTEEYRAEMGRLNTAFEASGYSTDTAKTAFTDFYKILGQTDTATEASQLLAKLALNEQDMATWTDIAAGVWGTFGESLPIEGLIESSNETAKTGKVVGVLADALNWAGISEDEFNQKLAECGSEAERNQLIMDTLAGEYDEAADAFHRNNAAIEESRENQIKLQDAMSQVGGAVTILKNKVLSELMPTITSMASSFATFLTGIDPTPLVTAFNLLLSVIRFLAPAITAFVAAFMAAKVILTVVQMVNQVRTAFTLLFSVLTMNPFMIVVTAIIGLITVLVTLWNTNESFRAAVTVAWEAIKNAFITAWQAVQTAWGAATAFFAGIVAGIQAAFATVETFLSEVFSSAWNAIQAIWGAAVAFFAGVWAGIQAVFSVVAGVLGGFFSAAWAAVQGAWSAAVSFFSGVWSGIQSIFSVVADVLGGFFRAAWSAVQSAWSNVSGFFRQKYSEIKSAFSSAAGDFASIGRNLMAGLRNGISSMAGAVIGAAQSIANSVKNVISSALNIASPSKWAIKTFGYLMEGAVIGMERGLPSLLSTTSDAMNSFKDAISSSLSSGIGMRTRFNSTGAVNGGYGLYGQPITIQQNIQAVPMTPAELARQSVNAFDRLRWR